MPIDVSRLTRNEHDVLAEALDAYESVMQARKVRARKEVDRAACEWRQYQADVLVRQLRR